MMRIHRIRNIVTCFQKMYVEFGTIVFCIFYMFLQPSAQRITLHVPGNLICKLHICLVYPVFILHEITGVLITRSMKTLVLRELSVIGYLG